MFSTACTQCGRPAALSLQTPDRLDCAACGFSGPASAEVAQALHVASGVLKTLNEKERQLTDQQRRTLSSSKGITSGYWLASLAVGIPLLACGAVGSVMAFGGKQISFWGAAVSLTPLALYITTVIAGGQWVKKRYTALAAACAALPPVSPGAPFACHVCGASLSPATSAVVRCGFCQADNVVSSDVVKVAAERRGAVTSNFQEQVRLQATAARSVANQATFALVASAIGAPIFTVVLLFVAVIVLSKVEGPVDLTYRYGVISTDNGNCIAHVYPRVDGKWLLGFGQTPPKGRKSIEERDTVDDLPAMTANDFTGKKVKAGDSGKPPAGTIERVHGNQIAGNEAVIGGKSYPVEGLCFDEP
ncbi:MAG: hypothetical protein IPK82_09700 [Polyangiaceae bacterium]|nr:hypothetical protein [Polyangiaceae bacterium]